MPPESRTKSSLSAFRRTSSNRNSSSGTIPKFTGSQPISSTAWASTVALESNTFPSSICFPGATSSSPVEIIPTFGRDQTQTFAFPSAANVPVSRNPSRSPIRSTTSPAPISEPAKDIPPEGTIGLRT